MGPYHIYRNGVITPINGQVISPYLMAHLVGTTTGSKDQEDLHQQTPLHLASQQGHLEVPFFAVLEGQQGHQLPESRKSHHWNLTANQPLKNDGWKTTVSFGMVCFKGPAVKLQVGFWQRLNFKCWNALLSHGLFTSLRYIIIII